MYTFFYSAAISIVSARCTEFTVKYSNRLKIYTLNCSIKRSISQNQKFHTLFEVTRVKTTE